ncbi:MAG TPA: MFS transporter [Ktedonobacterales bacterium]|nr:MFS transporter [Ktedonobacterales bacterium]
MWRQLARSLARFGHLRRNARLYLISNTLQAFTAGALGVLYTLFLASLGYGTTFIGVTLFVATAGGALGIVPASALVRRLGWRAMLLWSDLIGGVAIAAQLLAPTRAVVIITSLGIGASVAIFLVLNAPFLAANSDAEQRNAIFGLNNALGFLAGVTGSLVGGFLPVWITAGFHAQTTWLLALRPILLADPQARVYQLALLAAGIVAVPSIIPVLLLSDQREDVASAPFFATPSAPTPPLGKRLREWLRTGRAALASRVGRFSFSQALVGFGAGLFFPFLNIYFVNRLGASTAFYGELTAAVTALLAVVSLASAPLADRFGRVRVALAAQVASLPFMVAMGAAPLLLVVAACYIVRSALMNTGSAPLQAWLMDAVMPQRRVLASNAYNISWQGAWAVGAALGGGLIALGGYGLPFYVAAACYAVSAALLGWWFLPGRDAGDGATPALPEESRTEAQRERGGSRPA